MSREQLTPLERIAAAMERIAGALESLAADPTQAPIQAPIPTFVFPRESSDAACAHVYPEVWHGITPAPCMKCGR